MSTVVSNEMSTVQMDAKEEAMKKVRFQRVLDLLKAGNNKAFYASFESFHDALTVVVVLARLGMFPTDKVAMHELMNQLAQEPMCFTQMNKNRVGTRNMEFFDFIVANLRHVDLIQKFVHHVILECRAIIKYLRTVQVCDTGVYLNNMSVLSTLANPLVKKWKDYVDWSSPSMSKVVRALTVSLKPYRGTNLTWSDCINSLNELEDEVDRAREDERMREDEREAERSEMGERVEDI